MGEVVMEPMTPVLDANPLNFCEIVFAKDQPQYRPLPAIRTADGIVMTRWRLTWAERWLLFWRGSFYLQQMTFGDPLQPLLPSVEPPEFCGQ